MTREQIRQLKNWTIEIQFFDGGCKVKVGCRSFAFESVEAAMAEIIAYTKDPIGLGKKWAPDDFEGPVEQIECVKEEFEGPVERPSLAL